MLAIRLFSDWPAWEGGAGWGAAVAVSAVAVDAGAMIVVGRGG